MRRVPYKRNAMAIRYSDPGSIDAKIVQLQRVITTTHANHNRQLPGFSFLPKIFGRPISPATDRIQVGIDCDEVHPNVFVGDE